MPETYSLQCRQQHIIRAILRTMSVLTTCPKPPLVRASKASKIPRAHISPPPPKSARMFRGNVGFELSPGSIYVRVSQTVSNKKPGDPHRQHTTQREVVDIMAYETSRRPHNVSGMARTCHIPVGSFRMHHRTARTYYANDKPFGGNL